MHSKQLHYTAEGFTAKSFTARQKALMHSRQLQYTAESFTAQQEALLHSRKFCCIVEKSVLRQKLEKSSFCGRNWRKVSYVAETEDKPTLQCLPLDLDSTFVHNLAAAKWYFEAHSAERRARLPRRDTIYMVPRPLQNLGGDDSTKDYEFNSYVSCFLTLIKIISTLVLHKHHLCSFVP